jgi:hypothetical protein
MSTDLVAGSTRVVVDCGVASTEQSLRSLASCVRPAWPQQKRFAAEQFARREETAAVAEGAWRVVVYHKSRPTRARPAGPNSAVSFSAAE